MVACSVQPGKHQINTAFAFQTQKIHNFELQEDAHQLIPQSALKCAQASTDNNCCQDHPLTTKIQGLKVTQIK